MLSFGILALAASPVFFGVSGPTLASSQPTAVVQPNDNRTAAGRLTGSELHIALDARQALWYPDGVNHGPGVPIQVFAESGKSAQIPGPLIRVPLGTVVVAAVRNSIAGAVLTMHGMASRPAVSDRATLVPYGQTRVIRFRAGAPGTYFYWGSTTSKPFANRFGPDSQLAGAFVVDPPGSKRLPNDRIFVITQWINVVNKTGAPNFKYELDAINGRAWPNTEHLAYAKGEVVRWRWINASFGSHPLHLHGFFFKVGSRGDGLQDNIYPDAADRDSEVTELAMPGNTFTMTWRAERPGNWLFHCHLTYHTIAHMPVTAMLGGKDVISDADYENDFVRHDGMGGLILGFTVQAPASQASIADPPVAQHLKLTVKRAPDDRPDAPSFRYVLGDDSDPLTVQNAIGPPIVLMRGTSYAIDVVNSLNEPTAVHWHGMELADSYYDGVMGYSGYGTRLAPMIEPGQTFEALITPPRAGTFIYHTHMHDAWELRGGLAGPLIVLEPGKTYDPATDHVFTITTTHALADALKILVNGNYAPQAITVHAGVLQRFRLLNVTTFWTNAIVSLSRAGRTVQWSPLAVDGAYVSPKRRAPESAVETVTIGQTRDFTFMPTSPGDLQLQFWPDASVPNIVTVPIHVTE